MAINVDDLVARKTTTSYPHMLVEFSEALPLIVGDIEEGDIQVILQYNNQRRVVKRTTLSPINAKLLLDCVGPFKFVIDENTVVDINKIEDYLEVV